MIKRPSIIITINYIIGILMGVYLKKYIPILFISYTLINIFLFIYYKSIVKWFNIIFLVIIFSSIHVSKIDNTFYNSYSNNAIINENGVIVKIENETEYYNKYIVRTDKNLKLILKVKKNQNVNSIKFKSGDYIHFSGIFNMADENRNYKGYNYFNYLKTKKIYGICEVDMQKSFIIKNNSLQWYKMWICDLQNLLQKNLTCLIKSDNIEIANALLLGNNSNISEEQKNIFSDANLSHVLAISGMHVSYVILGVEFLLKKRSVRKRRYIFIVFLVFFAMLTGGSASVVRAVIMSILITLSKVFYRKSDTLNNISISCFLIILKNPYEIFNLGFQLSFLGTLGIVLFNSRIENKLLLFNNYIIISNKKLMCLFHKIIQIISVSISANILIIPILIYNYNSLSFVFIISNVLITPILGGLMIFGYITLILSIVSINLARIPTFLFNLCMQCLIKMAKFSSQISILKFTISTPKIITIISIYCLIFIFYFYFPYKFVKNNYKKIIIYAILIVFIFRINATFNLNLVIHFIDVGQGDSTLIVTKKGKTILIDSGGSEDENYNLGEKVLLPYLLDRQVKSLDYMIISHFDSDHCKAGIYIMQNMKVKNVVIGKQFEFNNNLSQFLEIANKKKINVIVVESGSRVNIEKKLYFDILWPNSKYSVSKNSINNNAMVCKLNYGSFNILFTGDIELEAEEKIVKLYGNKLEANVLKVAHHGSDSSSCDDFIKLVNPQIALIGVGKNNKYGHPSNEILSALNKNNIKVYRTDLNGEISIYANKNGIVKVKKCINFLNL